MKAVEVIGGGDKNRLKIGSRDVPAPKANQVLIEVFAAGVNRADLLQRRGNYPPPKGASDILGLEVAGKILKIDDNVDGFTKGDKVFALLEGGGYGQYAVAHKSCVIKIPKNLNFIEAASLPESLFTAWSNMFLHAGLKKGEKLLFHGGTSGIGVMVVQLSKLFGIDCIATAGSTEKCGFLEKMVVHRAINYNEEDFVEVLKEMGGVDVVIDMVGGDYWSKNLKVLNENGRLISIAMMKGAKTEVNFVPFLIKNLMLKGTTLRSKSPNYKDKIRKDLIKLVLPEIEKGNIKPVIDSVFDIEDAQKAHDLMQSSKHIGKIVLKF
jgi:NADPH2:quinone reductase